MKKALITMIIILSAFILGIVAFVVGVQLTSGKNILVDSDKQGAAASLAGKEDLGDSLKESGGQSATAIDPDYNPLEKQEPEKEEKKDEPEDISGIELDQPDPVPQTANKNSYPDYPQDSNEWYRVRTSAGSDGKQDGAFKSFANAKSHATTLKAQGYKVYDNNMKCIFTP